MSEHKESKAEDVHIPEGEVVYRAVRQDGDHVLLSSSWDLAFSGLAAGLSMGFSMAGQGTLRAHLPDAVWTPLITKLGYAVGFLIVVLGRQQLFTEQTLTAVLPVLARNRHHGTMANLIRVWAVILAANLVGVALFSAAAAWTPAFSPEARHAFAEIGREAMARGSWTVAWSGVPAGFLIATMVWLLPGSEGSRFWIILILAYVVGIARLAHVIAGSSECLFLVFTHERSIGAYVANFLLPSLIGNSAGGVIFVATLAHAQHGDKGA
jgi:formate/nitrite transporter FocA (FNT family)